MPNTNHLYRAIPSVERLSGHELLLDVPPSLRVIALRTVLAQAREAIAQGAVVVPDEAALCECVLVEAKRLTSNTLRPAINATGVLLHTNLGRATLAKSAAEAAFAVARQHATLETNEETGGRGSRQAHCAGLLCELTGAEDAYVVNNNAAATFLAIAALSANQETILSRGQMVEIGGHFRLPDVIRQAGAQLVEVGTTNRTRISDYASAITPNTAMLLRVHPSNYRIVGFTEDATLEELVMLGKERNICVADDIGSGALVDFAPYGLLDEPLVTDSVKTGADIIWFSGDKLLGGPQCGILVGTKAMLAPLKTHPLARALRPDKLTLAALEATLRLYATGQAWTEIPVLRRIRRPIEEIEAACHRVADALPATLVPTVVPTLSEVGGGSLPARSLSSFAVSLSHTNINQLAYDLRHANTPVYGRIEQGKLLLDLRAVDEGEEEDGLIASLQI
jgi:L-seryl-tRNA(Ser) seleniumtransferase